MDGLMCMDGSYGFEQIPWAAGMLMMQNNPGLSSHPTCFPSIAIYRAAHPPQR